MTTSILENTETIEIQENKEELCKKLCVNIIEGLMEGYEQLKQKNPSESEKIEYKINELKTEINRQKEFMAFSESSTFSKCTKPI